MTCQPAARVRVRRHDEGLLVAATPGAAKAGAPLMPAEAAAHSLADEVGPIESLRFAVPEWIMEFSALAYTHAWLIGEARRSAAP